MYSRSHSPSIQSSFINDQLGRRKAPEEAALRHVIGLVLTGIGAFILVMGVLVHFYVAPRLIQAPVDAYQVTRLEAVNASYFDVATLKVRQGATLTATNTVRGDVKSSRGGIAVWDSFTVV